MYTPEIGRVVISNAGRDKGRRLVITAVGEYITVADGKERKLSHPKRKNPKHLTLTSEKIDIKTITDKGLRRLFHG
jgi:ribosomal protein L14E/L6E/L27E